MNKEYKFYNVISDVIKYNQCKKAGVKQMLVSYYYLKNDSKLLNLIVNDNDIEVIVDSGLFSFSNSVDITEKEAILYSNEYIDFVKNYSDYKCFKSFFELDFDLIGYSYHDFVKPFQERLLAITNKIILICQKKRTIEDIDEMLEKDVETIAIPFFSQIERAYFDYHLIIEKAHNKNKRVHLLGCSTAEYLKYVEQSDSSSWFMTAAMGEEVRLINNKMQTFHYTESDEIAKDYDTRAIRNAIFYSNDFQQLVNKKKDEKVEFLRLF